MSEMTPEVIGRLIRTAYLEGLDEYAKQTQQYKLPQRKTQFADAVRQHVRPAWPEAPQSSAAADFGLETSELFRDRMAQHVAKTFWATLPENELKWSKLSYRAKNEITDTLTNAVKVLLLTQFGDRS